MIVVPVDAPAMHQSPAVAAIVREVRREAQVFVFLSGGASKMSDASKAQLLGLLQALAVIAGERKLAVGDGGTDAGLMAAVGEVRRTSGDKFLLIGVAPAPDVAQTAEPGKVAMEPNHTHVVTVTNEPWVSRQRTRGWSPDDGYWGSETDAMYDLFGQLAKERPSVTIVANGGAITLDEVRCNIEQGRTMIVVAGSGRAADAIVSVLSGKESTDEDVRKLVPAVEQLNVTAHRKLFEVFPLERGADGLTVLLRRLLEH